MTEETPADSGDGAASAAAGAPAGGGPPGERVPPEQVLRRGMTVGRYIVLEYLGHGGMGVVYAAFDPQLDRRVALKLVRPDRSNAGANERLSREAQVLAKLSHPNVVAVHEVGTHLGQVFMAMEFMAGGTLAEWLGTPRDGRLVLERFLEAGEGLAAAHRQDIIHLDFKPENVLLDGAGVAHVTDFGLAWTQNTGARRGGTNSYMAPEQRDAAHARAAAGDRRRGATADTSDVRESAVARASDATDQFSFCVALFRALFRQAPYAPPDAVNGRPNFPAGGGVPQHVRRALTRGLQPDPNDRFPSMDALLQALRTDPADRRRRVLAQVGLGLTLAVAVGVAVALASRESPKERAQRECVEAVRADEDDLWGAAAVATMRVAFANADPAHGAETFEQRVAPRVEKEVRAWADAATAQCTESPGAPGAEARARCLASRRRVLTNLAELFRRPDAEVVENAVNTVILEVLPVASCQSASFEPPAAPPPPLEGPALASGDELQSLLGSARVLKAAGKYPEAKTVALSCAALAEESHAGRVQAEAELLAGQLFAGGLDAEPTLKKAIGLAEAVGADEERAKAWMALAGWYAQRNRREDARFAAEQADAVVARLGRPEPLEADRLMLQGTLAAADARPEDAREAFDAALTLRRRQLGDEHPLVLEALARRADQLPLRSPTPEQLTQSRRDLEAVLAIRTRLFGPTHPETAEAEYRLGRVLFRARDDAAAFTHLDRARALMQPQEDREPLRSGRVLVLLSRMFAALERWAEALETGERSLELLEAGDAPEREQEDELRLLFDIGQKHPGPPEVRERLQKRWERLGP